jgi:hypothetical protein
MAATAHTVPEGIREGFFILKDYGPKLGMAFDERDPAGIADRSLLIRDLKDGQFGTSAREHPVQIVHLRPDGTWCDVTLEIMDEAELVAMAA